MICNNCGKESSPGMAGKFCSNCGVELLASSIFSAGFGNTAQTGQTMNASGIPSPILDENRNFFQNFSGVSGPVLKVVVGLLIFGAVTYFGVNNSEENSAVEKNNLAQQSYDTGTDSAAVIPQLEQASMEAKTNETKIKTKVNLAYVYSTEGQEAKAIALFKEALALTEPDSLEFYLITGEIAYLEKRPRDAQTAYDRAYSKDPNDFQVNNAMNLFYLDLDEVAPEYANYPKALVYALKAREVEKTETTKQNLAIAHYMNENYNQAIELFLTSDYNKQPYVAYWLGLSYYQKKDDVNAKKYLKIAMDAGLDVPQEFKDYVNSN